MSLQEKIDAIFTDESSIPPEYQITSPMYQTDYLVDGELKQWDGTTEKVYSCIYVKTPEGLVPKFLGTVPMLTKEASLDVLDAAATAYKYGTGEWAMMPVAERIECVRNFTYGMKSKREEVVRLLMWEIGKSFVDSCKEFDRTIDYIEETINALKDLDRANSRFIIEQGVIGQIRRSPLGVVLCLGPANYPLNETFTTMIPALIMGNTVILKPSRPGTLLFRPLLEAFKEAFPKGVVNTIYGSGREVASPLMSSGRLDGFAFIGSSKAANALAKLHPRPNRLRTILGLEAKNPAIVLPDADLDLTVKECILGSLSYNGQRCTALKILFVHSSIIDEFLEKFSAAIASLNFGLPWDKGVALTPLPEAEKPQYFTDLVEDAIKHGAKVINPGGGSIRETFFYPAVLYPVNTEMRVYHEEQFGPVIPVAAFDHLDTPLQYITDSNYGQQVSIFGQDPDAIAKLVDRLVNQVARVNLNSQCQRGPDTFPFTGRKDSAEGTLSVTDALRSFSIRSLVAAKEKEENKTLITSIVKGHKSNFLSTDFIL